MSFLAAGKLSAEFARHCKRPDRWLAGGWYLLVSEWITLQPYHWIIPSKLLQRGCGSFKQ